MKTSIAIGDFEVSTVPVLGTSAPSLHPDEAPGADNHDALDSDPAAVGPAKPAASTGPTTGEQRAAADLDASISAARLDAGGDGAP